MIYHKIKYALWFIFKSPQRSFGFSTLWQDIAGIISYLFLYFFPFIKPKPVSICVGIYNRSDLFLTKFIASLNSINQKHLVELSVVDCGSDDLVNLEAEIKRLWHGKLVYSKQQVPFSRSYSFNQAVYQSSNKIIFICDADFSLPFDLIAKCTKFTLGKLVWFPIVFYLYKNKPEIFSPQNGEWMQWGGKGLLACQKRYFENIGGLDESYTTWGKEDDNLWQRFYEAGYYIIRNRERGLLHHWHPSLNIKYQLLAQKVDEGLL